MNPAVLVFRILGFHLDYSRRPTEEEAATKVVKKGEEEEEEEEVKIEEEGKELGKRGAK